MHMPVNKPNVNCTYDSSHGTDEIYPKGPPHIYIYIYTYLHLYLYIYVYICIINIYIYMYIRVSPQLLQYIRSWQWRSQEKNDCVSHLSKALKAMYAR